MPACIVQGCSHATGQKLKYPNVTLHPFPKNIEMIKLWLQQTRQYPTDIERMSQKVLQGKIHNSYRMCSCHFSADSYMIKGSKILLKPTAMPTIFPGINFPQYHPSVPFLQSLHTVKTESGTDEAFLSGPSLPKLYSVFNVHTQTERKFMQKDQYCSTEHWINQRTVATQTDPTDILPAFQTQTSKRRRARSKRIARDQPYAPISTSLTSEKVRGHKRILLEQESSQTMTIPPVQLETPVKSSLPDITTEDFYFDVDSPMDCSYPPDEEPFAAESSFQILDPPDSTPIFQKDHVHERKFIIYESSLDILLSLIQCQHHNTDRCIAPFIKIHKKVIESMLIVTMTCMNGHLTQWESQPLEGEISIGNVQMAASILFSGSSFKKVAEMFSIFGIPSISSSLFFKYQKLYLFPAIHYEWEVEKKRIEKDLKDKDVILAGDVRIVGLGDRANCCTYTMMDSLTNKIVHFNIDRFGPRISPVGMEKRTFKTCLEEILQRNINVKMVATDRNAAIHKLMHSNYLKISHQFNVWHICKSLTETLEVASRKPNCAVLARWIRSITDHFWYCAKTCDHNPDLLVAKWQSLLYHIQNIHRFPGNPTCCQCEHKKLSKSKRKRTPWIKQEDKAFKILQSIITAPGLIKDIRQMEKCCHTGALEVYRRKIQTFCSKNLSYRIDSVYARTTLAALSHNGRAKHEQVVTHYPSKSSLEKGKKRSKIVSSKKKKDSVENPVFTKANDEHLMDIMGNVLKILKGELESGWCSLSSKSPHCKFDKT